MSDNNAALHDKSSVTSKEQGSTIIILAVILLIIIMSVTGFLSISKKPDTVQGMGEATEIRISGKLPGRVAELYVEEGSIVHKGDTLVRIYSTLIDARLSQAQAIENAASATTRKVDTGARPEIISSARHLWEQAQAAAEIAGKTNERMENLYKKGVISAQKRDEANAAYKAAKAAEATAKSQYDLALAGAQREDKEASRAMMDAAKSGVAEVDALLEDQYLTAPCDGTVTVIYPNESELVAIGAPIMSLQKDDIWAVFNVRESLLKDLTEGSVIRVKIPALDIEDEMTVFYIRDLGTYANWQATKSTGDYDARTFQIKARANHKIDHFRPGMSVVYLGVK